MFGFGCSCNILISDLRDFLWPGFVLVIKVGTFNVYLHQFGKLFFFLVPLFFLFSLCFFNTIFPVGLFSFILTADPAGHALGSEYIF